MFDKLKVLFKADEMKIYGKGEREKIARVNGREVKVTYYTPAGYARKFGSGINTFFSENLPNGGRTLLQAVTPGRR